jgi:alpha-tubulin suppressor-like RCC1 family protein
MLGWWIVPGTLYLFWVRFVPRHDLPGTALHVVLVAACIGFGFASYRGARDTLRGEKATEHPFTFPRVAAGAGLTGLVLLSIAAFTGWNPVTESRDSRLKTGLRVIGYRAYADVAAEDLSLKLDGWTPGDTTRLQGADLAGLNLRHVRASGAFLVNANLRGADLQGAILSTSNLEGSDLSSASLKGASLADIRLGGATLVGATLDSSDVRGADLHSVNLEGASLSGIRAWNDIRRVTGANLYLVRNPPEGFLEWAVANGAMCVESAVIWSAVRRGEMEIPSLPSDVDVHTYCGVSGEQEAVAVATVETIPAVDTMTALGATVQFEAIARDSSNNEIADRVFGWMSSDPTVAAVDREGTVVALATGTTRITATTGGVSSSAELTVSATAAEVVPVPEAIATVEVIQLLDTLTAIGDSVRLTAIARGSSGNPVSGTAFTWRTSNSSVVSVDTAGFATAVANGSATITATTPEGVAGSAPLIVSQVTFTVALTGGTGSILKDDTTRFTARPRDANGNTVANATVTWSSSNPIVATVNSTGLVRGRARGSTTIIAMNGPATGDATLSVTALEFAEVSAAVWHTCALTVNGVAYCWGANQLGQLGDRSRTDRVMPVPVAGSVRFRTVNSGHEDPAAHTCALTGAGLPYCWGSNTSGRLGVRSTVTAPALVQGGLRLAVMSPGFRHTCGVTTGDVAYCWGDNTLGALGNGTEAESSSPVPVSGQLAFRTISAGGFFTCGVTLDGAAYCWGMNRSGQLGNGTTDQAAHPSPQRVSAAVTFQSVAVGMGHACGVSTSGEVYCWGANRNGELGTGARAASATPVAVSGGLSFRMVSLGGHTCGVTTNGDAYCWGANASGQLGDGSAIGAGGFRAAPVRVAGRLRFLSVSVGEDHTCGVTTNRVVYCWGSDEHAKLGGSTTAMCSGRPCSRTPIRVRGQR